MKFKLFTSDSKSFPVLSSPIQSWPLILCLVGVAQQGLYGAQSLALKQIAEGFVSPSVVLSLPGASGSLLIADQVGTMHLLLKDGRLSERLFLDLRPQMAELKQGFDERGLLGVALHPKFSANRKFYVFYSAPLQTKNLDGWDHTSRVSEFRAKSDLTQAEAGSERVILQIDKPYFNHNGGALVFGPDGFLYISSGDGGNANDQGKGHSPQGNGQDLSTLMGKILRIDVDQGTPYGIPSDNPFRTGNAGAGAGSPRPEIFAYGLRNPWRMSFDRGGERELIACEVGQELFEEVNVIVKGGNYGWNVREGFHCFDPKNTRNPPASCPEAGSDGKKFLEPVFEYKNLKAFPKDPEAIGISVVGGYVYRGKALTGLQGQYIFADWSRNWVLPDGVLLAAQRSAGLSPDKKSRWTFTPLSLAANAKVGGYIVGLGEDAEGELYLMTNASNGLVGKSGKVFKLVAGP